MLNKKPMILVLAGPNGSGKSKTINEATKDKNECLEKQKET